MLNWNYDVSWWVDFKNLFWAEWCVFEAMKNLIEHQERQGAMPDWADYIVSFTHYFWFNLFNTNVLFLSFIILCAVSQNQLMLLTFCFLSEFAGVVMITIGSETIADIMPREKRGKVVLVWSVGPILGPLVGPIISGYVAEVASWRWMFWAISIAVSIQENNYQWEDTIC